MNHWHTGHPLPFLARQPSTAIKAREPPETLRHRVLGKKRRVTLQAPDDATN